MNRAARRSRAGRAALTGPRPWMGRRGPVILGPTEDRVARWLERMTRHGWVTIPTSRLIAELALERSEAYRITRQLRTLGLFGIRNDQGGTRGGRMVWRTPNVDDAADGLDASRHRVAWARVVAARGSLLAARAQVATLAKRVFPARYAPTDGAVGPLTAPSVTFREAMVRYGLSPGIMDPARRIRA